MNENENDNIFRAANLALGDLLTQGRTLADALRANKGQIAQVKSGPISLLLTQRGSTIHAKAKTNMTITLTAICVKGQ